MTEPLTFATLRAANLARIPLFKNRAGQIAHSKPDGSDWTPAQWLLAVAGEAGEAANVYKKMFRGDGVPLKALADELADVAIYWDLLGVRMGVPADPGQINQWKFKHYITPPQERFLGLFIQIGRLADPTKTEEEHLNAYFCIVEVLVGIARAHDIDLGEAVRSKFNEVSRRVGAEVYL